MTLQELIQKVKIENLSKEQLEQLHTALNNLAAELLMEMSELEQKEALFMATDEEEVVAKKTVKWRATKEGLRLIVIKRYLEACKKLINSVKSRIFAQL